MANTVYFSCITVVNYEPVHACNNTECYIFRPRNVRVQTAAIPDTIAELLPIKEIFFPYGIKMYQFFYVTKVIF